MKKGTFTTFATLMLITWCAISFQGYEKAFPLLQQFFSGGALAIQEDPRKSFADLLPICAAIIPIDMIVALLTAILVSILLGSTPNAAEKRISLRKMGSAVYLPQTSSNALSTSIQWINEYMYLTKVRIADVFHGRPLTSTLTKSANPQTSAFMGLMLLIIFEEVVARWLLVAGIPRLFPFLQNTVYLYILMILGNIAWALLHIPNYKDRHPIRTLTQFVPALMYNAVFLRFGLIGSLLLHFAFDAVLWAGDSCQKFTWVDILMILWSGFLACLMWAWMERPLGDVMIWLHNPESLALPGWAFWDYLKMDLFLAASSACFLDILLFDKADIGTASEPLNLNLKLESSGVVGGVIGVGLAVLAFMAISAFWLAVVYIWFWVSGLFVHEIGYRIVLACIFQLFLTQANSKSAVSRLFFQGLPDLFITFCVIEVLGFQAALFYIVVMALLDLPRSVLKTLDS
jgi:hypothetical protein